jgi:hypothetical protein
MSLTVKSLAVAAALLYTTASLTQDVFKWTDESGLVHYGNSVPDGVENFERVNLTPTPAATSASEPARAVLPSEPSATESASQVPTSSTIVTTPQPAGVMSLEKLDRLCEDARERAIAPLRTVAIEECKATPRNDPAYCERFYADYGEAGRTVSGTIRPRMFDDLPECIQAQQQRGTRGRR